MMFSKKLLFSDVFEETCIRNLSKNQDYSFIKIAKILRYIL